ncbi:hypothetical protein ACROYT_G012046 [Oculina patagonica]
MQWTVPCFFLFCSFVNFITADDRCRTEVSKLGMALKGFIFKKLPATDPYKCEVICEQDMTCQSYNYVIGEALCELNNRTKEARPENFRPDLARLYITRLNGRAPLGSIPELPAQSCQEIKASEGKDTISNKYWLDLTGNETAVLVYCDMIYEDIDECITGNHDCDVNANCTNTAGSHNCTCKEGYAGNGRSCSVCRVPLGMESGTILDSQITASSVYDANHAAHQARLHFREGGGKFGCWAALYNDIYQWLQVDLQQTTRITRIATQGRNDANHAQWVTKYKLRYGEHGKTFKFYRKTGDQSDTVFLGNTDSDSVVYNQLDPIIKARYIRVRPTEWYNQISMRMELYTC